MPPSRRRGEGPTTIRPTSTTRAGRLDDEAAGHLGRQRAGREHEPAAADGLSPRPPDDVDGAASNSSRLVVAASCPRLLRDGGLAQPEGDAARMRLAAIRLEAARRSAAASSPASGSSAHAASPPSVSSGTPASTLA